MSLIPTASSSKLFRIICITALAVGCITSIIQKNSLNSVDDIFSFGVIIISCISIYLDVNKKTLFSRHFFIVALVTFATFLLSYSNTKYTAIFLMFPISIIYSFIFVPTKRSKLVYLTFFSVCSSILLYTYTASGAEFLEKFILEAINITAYLVVLFFLCDFFVSQLRQKNKRLDQSKIEIGIQENMLSKQKVELIEKNELMTRYIESNSQLKNFASLASHELKAPLRNIAMFAKVISKNSESKLAADEKEYLNIITEQSMKLSAMVTDLQYLSYVSNSNFKLGNLKLADLIRDINDDRKLDILASRGKVNFDGNVQEITCYYTLFKQLLSNLIGNAIKFRAENVAPIVNIETIENEDNYLIKVSDNGIGIPEKHRAKIFNIFDRLHSNEDYEGSGIGLSICKKIVELHQGKIWVEQSSLGGTCFAFTISKNIDFEKEKSLKALEKEKAIY